jgi:hypothetical protein
MGHGKKVRVEAWGAIWSALIKLRGCAVSI